MESIGGLKKPNRDAVIINERLNVLYVIEIANNPIPWFRDVRRISRVLSQTHSPTVLEFISSKQATFLPPPLLHNREHGPYLFLTPGINEGCHDVFSKFEAWAIHAHWATRFLRNIAVHQCFHYIPSHDVKGHRPFAEIDHRQALVSVASDSILGLPLTWNNATTEPIVGNCGT